MRSSWLNDGELSSLLAEDVPAMDLTTLALGIGFRRASMDFFSRAPIVVAGAEEAARLLRLQGAEVAQHRFSGEACEEGGLILSCSGEASSLFRAWKIVQNILEQVSGIAGRARHLVIAARRENPSVAVAVTRKSFPGAKKLSLKGAMAGGATVHRLGLSESLLVFDEHRRFFEPQALAEALKELRLRERERTLVAEVGSLEEGKILAAMGVQAIQFEKMPPEELRGAVAELRRDCPGLTIAAAGGIQAENAGAYAATGVDILVTSSVFYGKPADIRVDIQPQAD